MSFFLLVFQLSIEQAQTVAEQVEMKAKVVQSEVKAVTARHKKALEERECELLWKVMGGRLHAQPPLWASTRPAFLREPHVRAWTPALNIEYLVVFQSLLAKEFRGPLEPCGCSPSSKTTRSLFRSSRGPKTGQSPKFYVARTRSGGGRKKGAQSKPLLL